MPKLNLALLYLLPLLFVSIFSFTSELSAQDLGTVRGIVSDATNGEALPFGNVFLEELNIGASTDPRGFFMIASILADRDYTLVVSYVGYETQKIPVTIEPGQITHLKIELQPESVELQTVEKIGQRSAAENVTDVGLTRIAVRDLESLPKGIETDLFRSLQYIPGVSKIGDISANYFVRGGGTNQNLILINNAPIYYPFHAFGIFSAIDPEIINSMEFFKGGFTCEYQSRLSSVLNLITKDGNKFKYGAKASLSMLTAKALVEGPIQNGSFILSGRASHSNQILKKFMKRDTPIDFYDFSAKVSFLSDEFMEGAKWTFHIFQSGDELSNEDPTQPDFSWKNRIMGINIFQITDNPLYYQVSFHWSRFYGEVFPNLSTVTHKINELDDLTFQADFNYVFVNKDELATGFKIMEVHNKLLFENTRGQSKNLGEKGSNWSLYIKYKLLRFEDFAADFGSRFNLTQLARGSSGRYYYEPRVSLSYRITPKIAVKGALGLYHQELTTLSDENDIITFFEPWLITPRYLKPATAVHYVFGLDGELSDELSFEIEGYYKDISSLPTLNERKFFSTDPDLVEASAEAYGWEFMTRYNNDPVSIVCSYALSWAYKEVDGWLYYPKYDSRHTGNLTFEFNLGDGWRASLIWNYSSGVPFTQLRGYYEKMNLDGRHNELILFSGYNPYAFLADKNMGRMPDYHKLDLSLSKRFELGSAKFKIDVSVLNVYDRKNIFYFERDTGKRVNMLPLLPSVTIEMEI
ncbi:carboxypeptidase-like regulatory domain-containing protein [Bacteroidota bacterium]